MDGSTARFMEEVKFVDFIETDWQMISNSGPSLIPERAVDFFSVASTGNNVNKGLNRNKIITAWRHGGEVLHVTDGPAQIWRGL